MFTSVVDNFSQQASKTLSLEYVMLSSAPLEGAELSLSVFQPSSATVAEVLSAIAPWCCRGTWAG